jgi:hypothetical protein
MMRYIKGDSKQIMRLSSAETQGSVTLHFGQLYDTILDESMTYKVFVLQSVEDGFNLPNLVPTGSCSGSGFGDERNLLQIDRHYFHAVCKRALSG